MKLRIAVITASIAAGGVLAFQIGSRLSDEAVMALAGVICGFGMAAVLAGIVAVGLISPKRADYTESEVTKYVQIEE